MADTDIDISASTPAARRSAASRLRGWLALAGAGLVFATIPLGILPLIYAVPVIGLLLALASPPDHVRRARPISFSRRNAVLGILLCAALSVVVWQPQLILPLIRLVGLEPAGPVLAVLTVAVLALPLALTEAPEPIDEPSVGPPVLTRRNLILSLTVMVTVATWYAGPGLSLVPIGILVLGTPVVLATTRLATARRGRLELGFWRHPWRAGLGPHRLQLVNIALLCALLALLLRAGVYGATILELSTAGYRVVQAAFIAGLVALMLLATLPLRRVRLGSNVLVLAGSVFLAVQLVMIYRPAAQPVTIASPLAAEWYVGQGGHAELVNYHRVTSTQSHALDIMQTVDGRTHRPGNTALNSYYVYDEPVLAPADGVVTFVLDGRPDLPIGQADSRFHAGNHIVIDIGADRYLMMGHLRRGSIRVRVGDRVTVGQQIARVGNSGNTTEPHIHIQAQTLPIGIGDITTIDPVPLLRTLHTYPLVFRDTILTRDGIESQPRAADPRRGDHVRPTVSASTP